MSLERDVKNSFIPLQRDNERRMSDHQRDVSITNNNKRAREDGTKSTQRQQTYQVFKDGGLSYDYCQVKQFERKFLRERVH